MSRGSLFKTAIDGTARRRMTVSAIVAGTQPVVHLRMRDASGRDQRPTDTMDLSLRQAQALMRALTAAIEAAETDPRRDGPINALAAREAVGSGLDDGWDQH